MRNRHEVVASERISNRYDDVRAAWLSDPLGLLQRATTTQLSGLFGAKLCVALGPLELAAEIVVDIVDIEQPHDSPVTKLVFQWGAMRAPELFPTMHATMSIYPLTPNETGLQFCGWYEPPLGLIGEAADVIAMHHVAKQSVARLLNEVARLLGRRELKEATPQMR